MKAPRPTILCIWSCTIALASLCSHAIANDPIGIDSPLEEKSWQVALADTSHQVLMNQFDFLARGIDDLLGRQGSTEESARSFVRLRIGNTWDEERGNDAEIRLRGKVHLPQINERLNLVFTGDNNEEITETRDLNDQTVTDDNERGVDVSYEAETARESPHSLDYRVGLRSELKLRVAARYRYKPVDNERWWVRLTEEPYWHDGRGFGVLTRADVRRITGENSFLRWSNRFDFGESTDGINWDTLMTWNIQPNENSVISYYAGADGKTRPRHLTTKYETGLIYRKNIWRPWFFYELEPAYLWRKDFETLERENGFAITARIEFLFDSEGMQQVDPADP